jgi:outer membrane receptor protein involved in Fe transport
MRPFAAALAAAAILASAPPARAQEAPEEAPAREAPAEKAPVAQPGGAPEEEKGAALEKAVEEATAGSRDLEVPEVTVTATRTRRDPFELPQSISIFDREDLAGPGDLVAVKALSRRDAGIWFDERTTTTSDPIIRGFTGFNLLALVDGNTLSTLWGEGGDGADDMYGKIDTETVERIEVLRGPSSALYGSNALGAVINVITRSSPLDFTEKGWAWGARTKGGFQSAANAGLFRQEVFGASPDFRFLLGGSAREFHDVRGGGDLGLLHPSGGRERNWDFSGEWKVEEDRVLRLTLQDVHRWDIKRFYRPLQNNANDREAVALTWNDGTKGPLWDELEARLYYQEKRDTRWWNDTGQKGEASTQTWQTGLRGTKDVGGGHVVTAGLSVELDHGDSPDDEQFTYVRPPPVRRDAPLSDWWDWGIYAQDEWRVSRPVSLLASARYDAMRFETDVDSAYVPQFGNPADDQVSYGANAVTGGLGAVLRATDEVHFTANWARGYHQSPPGFGIRQLGVGALIPNGLLDPTTSDNFELGVKTKTKGLRFDASWYYSSIHNWLGGFQKVPSYHGQTYYDFDGDGVKDINEGFVEQTAGGDAWVNGVELRWNAQPGAFLGTVPPEWSVWGSFAWNKGRVDPTREHPQGEPLRHTQPPRCLLALRWDEVKNPARGLYAELVADMVGKYDEIPSDRIYDDLAWRRDPQDGTSPLLRAYGGVPGYTVFHVYGGLKLSDRTTLRLGIENLSNKKYRSAHSRMDAPGVNFIGTLEVWF